MNVKALYNEISKKLQKIANIMCILLLPTFLLLWFFNYRGILTAFVRALIEIGRASCRERV